MKHSQKFLVILPQLNEKSGVLEAIAEQGQWCLSTFTLTTKLGNKVLKNPLDTNLCG